MAQVRVRDKTDMSLLVSPDTVWEVDHFLTQALRFWPEEMSPKTREEAEEFLRWWQEKYTRWTA